MKNTDRSLLEHIIPHICFLWLEREREGERDRERERIRQTCGEEMQEG